MTEAHPQSRIVGYARVSTYGQTLDEQLEHLKAVGILEQSFPYRAELRPG